MEKNNIILISCVSVIFLITILVLIFRNRDNKSLEEISFQSFDLTAFSANTGTKRSLLIGCNYFGTNSELFGCIQDVKHIQILLNSIGYEDSDMIMLIDDGTTEMPTKQNIIENLTSLVNLTSEGDTLFIWYSGHGTQLRNRTSDGGFDECWCPTDTLQSRNYLTDNELISILNLCPENSNIFVGSDSCHSATVLDLRYIAQQNESTANRSLNEIRGKEAISEICFAPLESNKENCNRIFKSVQQYEKSVNLSVLADSSFPETSANIVCISGCQDYDTSADAYLFGKSQGAMTWAFLRCINETMTMSELLVNMRNLLSINDFPQIPQLTFGKMMNPNTTNLLSFFG
jgi:hypothetical protein